MTYSTYSSFFIYFTYSASVTYSSQSFSVPFVQDLLSTYMLAVATYIFLVEPSSGTWHAVPMLYPL
jgi:hypothetical protein